MDEDLKLEIDLILTNYGLACVEMENAIGYDQYVYWWKRRREARDKLIALIEVLELRASCKK